MVHKLWPVGLLKTFFRLKIFKKFFVEIRGNISDHAMRGRLSVMNWALFRPEFIFGSHYPEIWNFLGIKFESYQNELVFDTIFSIQMRGL